MKIKPQKKQTPKEATADRCLKMPKKLIKIDIRKIKGLNYEEI